MPVPSGSAPTPPSCKPRQALAISDGAGLPRFLGLSCKLRDMLPREPRVLPSMGKLVHLRELISRTGLMWVSRPRGLLAPGCHRLSHPQ